MLALAHDAAAIGPTVEADIARLAERGVRALAVARTRPAASAAELDASPVWELLGILTFLDPPRPDTAATIARAKQFGVSVKMITGDHRAIAVDMCHQLGMGDRIEVGWSQCNHSLGASLRATASRAAPTSPPSTRPPTASTPTSARSTAR